MDAYQTYIHRSKYARYLPSEKRREEWHETVDRYINFVSEHLSEKYHYNDAQTIEHLRNGILNMEVMPSMRAMMAAGKAAKRDNVTMYNCSYLPVDDMRSFDEAMYILMCGTGVGFSVERQYVNQLPEVPDDLVTTDEVIKVGDSKEGWARAYRDLIFKLYSGKIPTWDMSAVRPAGTPLKTFGGRASGPEPLAKLFKYTVSMFRNAAGRRLTSIECHDLMCMIADIVVVGGVRRSAMISLSNLSDQRMRAAKTGEWWALNPQRMLSNNSAVYTEKPEIGVFMEEWLSLYNSKSGERGIFNREASKLVAARNGRRNVEYDFGVNPCSEIVLRPYQFCVAKNTPLVTKNGIVEIETLRDKKATVWNGSEWTEVTVRRTGTNQRLVRVHLSDGSYLDCTPDHRWSVKDRFQERWSEVQAQDLMSFSKYALQVEPANVSAPAGGKPVGNAYTLGFAVGDGCVYNERVYIDLYGEKDWECPVQGTRYKPRKNYAGTATYVRCDATKFVSPHVVSQLKTDASYWLQELGSWDTASVLSFVAGLADADGSETNTGGIRIYIAGYDRGRAMQLLLAKHGIRCSLNLHQKAGTETNLSIRKRDSWYVQITDCTKIPCHRLDVSRGHAPVFKGKYQVVTHVEEIEGLHDTYCFNEPKRHKAMFGNVLTYQCNLSEVIVRADDTPETLAHKVRLATILGTFQSTFTHFPYLRRAWKKNTEEERLLGVSMTGIYDNKLLNNWRDKKLPELLQNLRQTAIDTNKVFAERLGIPQSTAITCVKPSGTVSQLTDTASGIHPRHERYYFRRVRQDNKDPLTQYMINLGVHHEPDVMKPEHTTVFSFPKKAPKTAVMRSEITALDHLELWLQFQRHWSEHKPSVTISVKEHEWMAVGAWVFEHFDEVSGISFLPYDGGSYQQAPYEEVTKEQYEDLLAKTPKEMNWSAMVEHSDLTESAQTLACSAAGGCEL